MPRLVVSRARHPAFHAAAVRAKVASERDLLDLVRALARSKEFLKRVRDLDEVPALLRRSAAVGGGPRELFAGGSLVELALGTIPPPRASRPDDPPIEWESSRPRPPPPPRRAIADAILPLEPPRRLSVRQASFAVYCFAEATARATGVPPCLAYFFYRDWLVDQVKVREVDDALRASGARLLDWFSGAPDPELDDCAARAPPRDVEPADEAMIAVRFEPRSEGPRFHPTQPPTPDHPSPATCRPAAGFAHLEFDRARVEPLAIWRAMRRVDERAWNLVFDDRRVYLAVERDAWRRLAFEEVPLALASRATRDRPVAPFLAAAYLAGSVDVAARGLCALIFGEPRESDLAILLPSMLAGFPDVAATMRADRPESREIRRDEPGFFAGLNALISRRALRGISREGWTRLDSAATRAKLAPQFERPEARVASLVRLSEGQFYRACETPRLLEELACVTPGIVALAPPARARAEPPPEGADQFVRALYEAERLASEDPEPIARSAPTREIAEGLPADRAFFAAPRRPSPAFEAAHADAEACAIAQPIRRVRARASLESAEDMDSVDLRGPRDGSPFARDLEAVLDDRSGGETAPFGRGWRAAMRSASSA